MRILVTTNAAIGHFLPMAPTVVELLAAGHDVRIGCPESFAPFLRRAGLDALPCRETDISVPVTPPPPAEDRRGRLMWAVTQSSSADCHAWVGSVLHHAAELKPRDNLELPDIPALARHLSCLSASVHRAAT